MSRGRREHVPTDPAGSQDGHPKPTAVEGAATEWTPVARPRTYELVLDRIEHLIVTGEVVAGQRLPAERDLAVMLGVSRPAVREALRILEAQGVAKSRVGTGPDSGTVIHPLPSDALGRLLRVHVALGSFALEDVIATRVALERSAIEIACRHATPEETARIQEKLLAMDVPDIDRETFNGFDTEFHVAIADAGGNRLMSDITGAIRESVRLPILATLSALPDTGPQSWPTVRDGLRADHHAIFEAFREGRAELAAELVDAHIRRFAIRLERD
jgi:GntR family transcriptional repressor for pyruvate dehydrogenase complex